MGKSKTVLFEQVKALLLQAGIDPKTFLPTRLAKTACTLKSDITKAMRIIDEQDAVNRYKWYNLPCNISSQELERLLYYKGQLAFFYLPETDEFFFMPYALDGTIDFYGRYKRIHPVPVASGGSSDEEKKQYKLQVDVLSMIKRKCLYAIPGDADDPAYKNPEEYCVLLWDYSKQLSETIIPRKEINDPIVKLEAEILPYMRTSLLLGTGIKGMRVNTADESDNVEIAGAQVQKAAETGIPWIALVGNQEFQDLANGPVSKAQEYLLAMQAVENIRLGTYGLDNGGIFQKKAHELEEENAMNSANNGIVFQDGLTIRQNFCDIVNSIFGLGIWCEPAESAVNYDINQDGVAYDENESQTGMDGGYNDGSNNNEEA